MRPFLLRGGGGAHPLQVVAGRQLRSVPSCLLGALPF